MDASRRVALQSFKQGHDPVVVYSIFELEGLDVVMGAPDEDFGNCVHDPSLDALHPCDVASPCLWEHMLIYILFTFLFTFFLTIIKSIHVLHHDRAPEWLRDRFPGERQVRVRDAESVAVPRGLADREVE